jgi:hypothetical protein
MATEKQSYIIVKKDKNIELREYASAILASVTVDASSHGEASSKGFSLLADYIFGNNIDTTNIKMTAPVITTQTGNGLYEVSFVMPSKYTIESIPVPMNKAVIVHQVASHQAAAILFSGYSAEHTITSQTKLLIKWLEKNSLIQKGDALVARYDPPWKPGFMRLNEIIMYVDKIKL